MMLFEHHSIFVHKHFLSNSVAQNRDVQYTHQSYKVIVVDYVDDILQDMHLNAMQDNLYGSRSLTSVKPTGKSPPIFFRLFDFLNTALILIPKGFKRGVIKSP